MGKYAVIGGQYAYFCYGFSDTLHGAKMIATKNVEYWDNWQGWHTPKIYKAEDVIKGENFFGTAYCPKEGACPVAIKIGGKWYDGRGE